MADNIVCRNCGHYETTHIEGPDSWPKKDGYKYTLKECVEQKDGYNPDPKEVAEIEKQDKH